jgi:hypothetical protein
MLQGNPVKCLNHREVLGGFFVFGDSQFPSYYGGVPKGRGGFINPNPPIFRPIQDDKKQRRS